MKKYLILLSLVFVVRANAQPLSNTKWTVYDTSNVLFAYFKFGADTVYFSSNNISYTKVSTYTVNGNNFTIKDILGGGPCPSYTGLYTFLTQNDTLKFTLVSDGCFSRPTTLASYHWVSMPTGISEMSHFASVNVYPNPASGQFVIETNTSDKIKVEMFDVNGRQLFSDNLHDKDIVNLGTLNEGVYTLTIKKYDRLIKKKLVILR